MNVATPIAANVKSQDMIVDFGEKGHLVPIHAEFEEPLHPKDYNAYGGGALNFRASSTTIHTLYH